MPVSADGTAYELAGNPEGLPVVLVHGLGLCRSLWKDHLPAFERQYRIINYDLFGHGESNPPLETASLAGYARQIADLMDHLDIPKAAIVGFSIGGMINRRFAIDFPDKVSALAILNSPHDRGAEAQAMVEDRAAKVRNEGAMATMDDALKRWFTSDYLEQGPAAQKVREWRGNVDPASYAQAAWVLANGVRELIKPDISINCPCLVITCENDSGSTPKMSYDIAAEIEGSETVIIPQLQHLGLMEKPELFTKPILDFLGRVLK